jgi:hypothetical protein
MGVLIAAKLDDSDSWRILVLSFYWVCLDDFVGEFAMLGRIASQGAYYSASPQ